VAAVGLGGWFVVEAHALVRRIRRDEPTRPMKLFHISISYMALVSVAIIVDVLV
jgi:protoheme IX farnesyltransferase